VRSPWRGVLVVAVVGATACDALMVEPAPDAGIEVQLELEPQHSSHAAYGDFTHILAQVTRVTLTVIEGGSARDTLVAAAFEGSMLRVRASLRPNEVRGWVELRALLSLPHGGTVFRGHALVPAHRPSPSVVVHLTPVAASLLVPQSYPMQLAVGDTVVLEAQPLFATGDVIQGAPVTFSTLTPEVLEILESGRAVSRGNGFGVVSATSLGMTVSRSITVRQAVVRLTGIGPADTTISVGQTFQARPFGEDPNGSPLLRGANVVWSGGGSVTVLDDGRVTAVSPGDGFVDVTAGSVTHRALITVVP
jgi:hypothetical protein